MGYALRLISAKLFFSPFLPLNPRLPDDTLHRSRFYRFSSVKWHTYLSNLSSVFTDIKIVASRHIIEREVPIFQKSDHIIECSIENTSYYNTLCNRQ